MLNEQSSKLVAFGLVIIFVVYHGSQYFIHGDTTCHDLLTSGRYIYGQWQPLNCMIHHYSSRDIPSCLNNARIIFIGDSRIRELYYGLLESADIIEEFTGDKHSNKKHVSLEHNAIYEFLWHPEVNSSTIALYEELLLQEPRPTLIVHGAGTWTIKLSNNNPEALLSFKTYLTKAATVFNKITKISKMAWLMQAPVQPEYFDERRLMITNAAIAAYNEAADEVLGHTDVALWYSLRDMASQIAVDPTQESDGLHMPHSVVLESSQVLMNWYCNAIVKPRGASCCTAERPKLNTLQATCFALFICCLVISCYLYYAVRERKIQITSISETSDFNGQVVKDDISHTQDANDGQIDIVVHLSQKDSSGSEDDVLLQSLESSLNIYWHLTKFGIIMTYFYICDRTDIFPRTNKHFQLWQFAVPLIAFLMYGIYSHKVVKRPDILNLEQTKEWKGWMQLIILVYHFTGASQKIPIYMQLRDIVAAYFFMSGFGQFFVSWSREKFGLNRVCEVVFRYNFFVFFLCLVMDRPYQLYYFVPLITFWYFIIYVTMVIYPRATKAKAEENSRYYYWMVLKLTLLVFFIFLLASSQTFFYLVFDIPPFNELFRWPGTSMYEWWFRWQLDRLVVPFGMIVSFVLITVKSKKWIDDSNDGDLFSRKLSIFLTIVAVLFHAIHITRAFFCISKPSCNELHPYISWIPILSIVLFRNVLGILRNHYSIFFAWVGSMSLELFVGQYHVWLAEDTTGILVLVPHFPLVNVLVTSFVFVCIALEVRDISVVLTSAVIPQVDKANPDLAQKTMLKRLFLFLLLMLLLYLYKLQRVN